MKIRYTIAVAAVPVASLPAAAWAADRAEVPQGLPCYNQTWMPEHIGEMGDGWAEMEAMMGGRGGMLGGVGMPHAGTTMPNHLGS